MSRIKIDLGTHVIEGETDELKVTQVPPPHVHWDFLDKSIRSNDTETEYEIAIKNAKIGRMGEEGYLEEYLIDYWSSRTYQTAPLARNEEAPMFDDAATPDELEAAALNLAAKAAAIRKFDAIEPQGDEPTISFQHTYPGNFSQDIDPKTYTFVGFKSEAGWHLTGTWRSGGPAMTWRELGSKYPAIAAGDFLVATGWAQRVNGEPVKRRPGRPRKA